jgi:hypothetical protein
MKSFRLLTIASCIALALLLILQPIRSVWAKASEPTTCALAAVHGSYEFVAPAIIQLAPGTVSAIPDEYIATSPAALANKGTLLFTGDGHIIVRADEDANGPLATPVNYTGEYVIHSNCTSTMTLANGTHFGMKLVSFGGVDDLVSTTPGFVIVRPAQILNR